MINAMVCVRGQRRDYQGWQDAVGTTGQWSYDDLLPHFIGMEGSDVFAGPLHGTDGPLKVSQPVQVNALNQAVIKAFQQVGLPYNPDYNAGQQRGVGPCQLTIGDAHRCSSAVAFLDQAKSRPNLTIRTRALVTNIVFEGNRAVGVYYVRSGKTERALAGEVVLSAGALNSPRILMLSGIGPEAELTRHGIEAMVSSPDVGRNLQDHPQVLVGARCRTNMGYAKDAKGFGMIAAGMRYYLTRQGPAATNGIESVSYYNPDDPDGEPTIQSFHSAVIADEERGNPQSCPGLTINSVVLQPRSR